MPRTLQRTRHLKCDKNTPCARCVASDAAADCTYVVSHRGTRNCLRQPQQQQQQQVGEGSGVGGGSRSGQGTTHEAAAAAAASEGTSATSGPFTDSSSRPTFGSISASSANAIPSTSQSSSQVEPPVGDWAAVRTTPRSGFNQRQQHSAWPPPPAPAVYSPETYLNAFYYYFYATHPFVLPQQHLDGVAAQAQPLLSAMRWVGSLFLRTDGATRSAMFQQADRLVHNVMTPKDGFLVQAMMLLVLGLDGSCMRDRAEEMLDEVEQLAVHIGLDTAAYAELHGRGVPVLEESWRRTWWNLYVVDGVIAAVRRVTSFPLFDVPSGVGLPCEEHEYLSAVSQVAGSKTITALTVLWTEASDKKS